MSIKIKPNKEKIALTKLIEPASRLVAAAVDLSSGGAPVASFGNAIFLEIVSLFVSSKDTPSESLNVSAWEIIRAAYVCALVRFIREVKLQRRPTGKELETLIANLLRNAELVASDTLPELRIDHLQSPLKNPLFRDAAARIPHEFSYYGLESDARSVRLLFEKSLFQGLKDARDASPEKFRSVESVLSSKLTLADERRKAQIRHEEYLIRMFTQDPIFGQENSGITLNDLYVRQRCLWHTLAARASDKKAAGILDDGAVANIAFENTSARRQVKNTSVWHIGYLHSEIDEWLSSRDPRDSVRVVSGGPGSGKSTFARALAIDTIDTNNYDVVYVPLQEIDSAGSLETRISNLFRGRTELGFDRVESPLQWLGQGTVEGEPPEKPLLLICDGLDEIAPPETAESTNVTADFIQTLGNWLNNRNSGGCYAKAVVLGRTIAAEEAFEKLAMDPPALLRVAGLLPISNWLEWKERAEKGIAIDLGTLAPIDQRKTYWENWCRASGLRDNEIPEALEGQSEAAKALEDLTTEPLLLYLLLWTEFVGARWKEAAQNRNVVYEEIFKRIFKRDWGTDTRNRLRGKNRQTGGHVGTSKIDEAAFFALQETLGLASWPSGGRIVTEEAFKSAIEVYLDDDIRDDISKDPNFSLKSVALQSYTRSSSEERAGYEFVHKSLGEYLIARALVSASKKALDQLSDRVTDSRCARAAEYFSKIGQLGPLTNEIHRFFIDEVRTRFTAPKIRGVLLDKSFPGLMNWILRNGFPVHLGVNSSRTYYSLQIADTRCLDVMWSFGQALFDPEPIGKKHQPGRLALTWPTSLHLSSMFSRLADRVHVAETKRLASFNNISLEGQGLTELAYGSVIFVADTGRPQEWQRLHAQNTHVVGAEFFAANLWSAEFSGSTIVSSNFVGAKLVRIDFRETKLKSVDFDGADLAGANFIKADMEQCTFPSVVLGASDFTGAKMKAVRFGRSESIDEPYTRSLISDCDMSGAELVEVDFGDAEINGLKLNGATLTDCDFSGCDLKDIEFEGAVFMRVRFSLLGSQQIPGLSTKEGVELTDGPESTGKRPMVRRSRVRR